MRDMTDAEKENAAFEDGILFEQRRTKEVLLKIVTLFTTFEHNTFDHSASGKSCVPCQAEKAVKKYEEFENDEDPAIH